MRDPRIERIEELYGDTLTAMGRNSMRAGFVVLFFAAVMWAFWWLVIRHQDNAQQQFLIVIGATLFGLVLLLGWPVYRIRRRASVAPRVRAFLYGERVDGTIESIETTNIMVRSERTNMLRVTCRYSVGGRTYRCTSIPFPCSLLRGRSTGDVLPVYVDGRAPERGEVDIFGIRER